MIKCFPPKFGASSSIPRMPSPKYTRKHGGIACGSRSIAKVLSHAGAIRKHETNASHPSLRPQVVSPRVLLGSRFSSAENGPCSRPDANPL